MMSAFTFFQNGDIRTLLGYSEETETMNVTFQSCAQVCYWARKHILTTISSRDLKTSRGLAPSSWVAQAKSLALAPEAAQLLLLSHWPSHSSESQEHLLREARNASLLSIVVHLVLSSS